MLREKLKITSKGVFLIKHGKRRRVAEPIHYEGIGARVADGTKLAEISFIDLDGKRRSEMFELSYFQRRNRHKIIDRLADKGYQWPTQNGLDARILQALTSAIPARRFQVVGAPGWYGTTYVTSDREYPPKKQRARLFLIDEQTGASVAKLQFGPGSLKGWKKNVGKVAVKSSLLRLAIAAAFAAPVLRLLKVDSFGLNLYGASSSGKTTALIAAASVSGLLSDGGLPGWADSDAAIEQLFVGHRDGLLPLDETGDGGSKGSLAKRARAFAFGTSRNRPRNLDKTYQRGKLTTRDWRSIVLISSERALGSIAIEEGTPRLPGEEVRLIDVLATEPEWQGIFDRPLPRKLGRSASTQGARVIDKLRRDSISHQGHPLDAFLRELTRDPHALSTMKSYLANFEQRIPATKQENTDHRISRNFAAIYAAAALAIDYRMLPWSKKQTWKDIQKFRTGAVSASRRRGSLLSSKNTLASAAADLKNWLEQLNLLKIRKGKRATAKGARRREQADGFDLGQEIYIKPHCLKSFDATKKQILIQHDVWRAERQDASTIARKVSGVAGKRRYVVIDTRQLAKTDARPSRRKTQKTW